MGERKKILIIHPVLAPYRVDFFNHMGEYYNVKLLLLKNNLEDNPFNQIELQSNLNLEKKVLRNVIKIRGRVIPYNLFSELKNYKPDIVICSEFSITNNLVLIFRRISNKHFKILTISDDNEFRIHKPGSLLRKLNRNFICKAIDGIITLKIPSVIEFYLKKVKGNKVIGIDHIIRDQKKFRDQFYNLNGSLNNYKLDLLKRKKILFVGRLVKEKGLDILIKAISLVIVEHPDIVVFLVGNGKELFNLRKLIKSYNLEKVIFLEGRKEALELLKYYLDCDLFILPSRYEPFGAVVNEALLAGLPVICSNRVGAKYLIDEGLNGSIFNIEDESTFINSLNYWLTKISIERNHIVKDKLTDADVKEEVKRLSMFIDTI